MDTRQSIRGRSTHEVTGTGEIPLILVDVALKLDSRVCRLLLGFGRSFAALASKCAADQAGDGRNDEIPDGSLPRLKN